MPITSPREILKDLFKPEEPLGPEKIKDTRLDTINIVPELVSTNNIPYKKLVDNPRVIIGRRGSGKSSILRSFYFNNNYKKELLIDWPQAFGLTMMATNINKLVSSQIFVENISNVWEFLITTSIAINVKVFFDNKGFNEINYINDYLQGIGIYLKKQESKQYIEHKKYINQAVDFLIENPDIAEKIDFYEIGGSTYNEIIVYIQNLLKIDGSRLAVMIDSLEDMKLDTDGMQPALSGLLRSMQQFKYIGSKIDIICSIPAEIYFALQDNISEAPLKDFSGSQTLHWSYNELMQIAASRLSIYLQLYGDIGIQSWVNSLDLNKKDDVNKFFYKVLPNKIKNGVGIEENTLGYIVRHTQLLPRHIIEYMNAIFFNKTPEEIYNGKVTIDDVVAAIHKREKTICVDILNGYQENYEGKNSYLKFNNSVEICQTAIPNLPIECTYDDIEYVYKKYLANQFFLYSPADLMRVLIEVGAIGRKISGHSKTYRRAYFEYIASHKLMYKADDIFLVHPCFIGSYGRPPSDLGFAVYPLGSHEADVDYRVQGAHYAVQK